MKVLCTECGLPMGDVGPTNTTCMGIHTPYADSEGRVHRHDPNRRSTTYACANDHQLLVDGGFPCPIAGCDYPGWEPSIVTAQKPL